MYKSITHQSSQTETVASAAQQKKKGGWKNPRNLTRRLRPHAWKSTMHARGLSCFLLVILVVSTKTHYLQQLHFPTYH
jgi:hypothetical protein